MQALYKNESPQSPVATKLPGLSEEKYNGYFNEEGVCIYPLEYLRTNPPSNIAFHLGHIVYQVAVGLVNSGQAYNVVTPLDGTLRDLSRSSIQVNQVNSSRLIAIHNKLIPIHSKISAGTSYMPYHFLFLAKIALDHLSPALIEQMYLAVAKSSDRDYLGFPNGTLFSSTNPLQKVFDGANVMYAAIYYYILSSPEKFPGLVTEVHRNEACKIVGDPEPSRIIALFRLNMRKELAQIEACCNKPRTNSDSALTIPSSYYFSLRDESTLILFSIEEEKKLILADLKAYVSVNKASYLTRTNIATANELIAKIEDAPTLLAIDALLVDQEKLFEAKTRSTSTGLFFWFQSGNNEQRKLTDEEKSHSGFYRALQSARKVYNELTGRNAEGLAPAPAASSSIRM